MVTDLVAAGVGIGFLPRGVAKRAITDSERGLTVIRVRGLNITRRIDLAVPRGQAASPAARALAKRLRDTVRAPSAGRPPHP